MLDSDRACDTGKKGHAVHTTHRGIESITGSETTPLASPKILPFMVKAYHGLEAGQCLRSLHVQSHGASCEHPAAKRHILAEERGRGDVKMQKCRKLRGGRRGEKEERKQKG